MKCHHGEIKLQAKVALTPVGVHQSDIAVNGNFSLVDVNVTFAKMQLIPHRIYHLMLPYLLYVLPNPIGNTNTCFIFCYNLAIISILEM